MRLITSIITLVTTAMAFSMTACAQNTKAETEMSNKKVMVAYFSATGTTKSVAEKISSATSGTLVEIAPEQPYTSDDLNWHNSRSRSSVEMADSTSRPAIKPIAVNCADYDVIFIGYPIWWDLAPRAVNTFIESQNLKGKTVIPFATSGGSTITNSVNRLKKSYPDINITEGRLLNNPSDTTISAWVTLQLK